MNTACIGPHGDTPPQPEPGLLICLRCRQRLGRDLSTISGLWGLLGLMLQPGNGASSDLHGKPGSRPPCNLDVADITDPRGTVTAQLTSWARVVIEDRNLAPRRLDAEQAARLLAVHADWIAAQPWVDEAMAEIRSCAHAVRRACHDLPDPPLGVCPDIDPSGETDRCGGPLRWHDGVGVHGGGAVICGRCGSTWGDRDLPHLLRVVQPTRRFPVERDWVVSHYAITPGQLRTWVWRGQVRTTSSGHVDLFDVLARLTDTPTAG